MTDRDIVSNLHKKKKRTVTNIAIKNHDEWLKYMMNSIQSLEEDIGERPWSINL